MSAGEGRNQGAGRQGGVPVDTPVDTRSQACAGLKVVEFAAYAAGPVVGKHLGDHGATVVHVESLTRRGCVRLRYARYTDNRPGVNRSGTFALCNNNKYSVTIDLKAVGGIDLARRVVAWADVVIENFTPGTMKRLGLGYEDLSEINPSLVMLSSCNQGQTGPHAKHPGFGSQLTSLSGFTHVTGFPNGDPCLLYGPYIDFIGVGYGLISVLAALDYRKRTGRGVYIDLAQYEAGCSSWRRRCSTTAPTTTSWSAWATATRPPLLTVCTRARGRTVGARSVCAPTRSGVDSARPWVTRPGRPMRGSRRSKAARPG